MLIKIIYLWLVFFVPPKMKFFDFNNALSVLESKGILSEVWEIIDSITIVDHNTIQKLFSNKGWGTEKQILPETNWKWDAYKNKVVVSIEFSLIDAVHRDLFRLLMWYHQAKHDAVIYITTTFKEPKFHNVKRDFEICSNDFPHLISYPIILIGLEKI